jgi:hypothetical protein
MSAQRVFVVRPGEVVEMLPSVMPFLEKMCKWTAGRRSIDDIVRRVLMHECNLWITKAEDGHINGAIITKVEPYEQAKMLHILHAAGEKGQMAGLEDELYTAYDAFAKFNHCSGIEFIGRPGWKKYVEARGYKLKAVMYEKRFAGEAP